MREIIETAKAPAPIGPYSQAVRANGFIFVSGQIPIDPGTGNIAGEDIVEQTHQVMKNLAAILQSAGSGLDKIIKTSIFLTNLDDFARLNQVYGEYVGESRPARATVQVGKLPRGALVEIEAVALPIDDLWIRPIVNRKSSIARPPSVPCRISGSGYRRGHA